ncbi:phosphatidylinositol transporter [Paracoccidioides lutzii Pb01]|uniref:Phosphatidylinositol transfer protein SFH5 n=1 Tax=Paracoccidioides lutzii (strain ATCC MYA-826 / Pb01) TaxID=502779 RepID=C1H0I2_PARBA|nr:phosphatidylinositol transporter [Paracoccidioides lutzii Pb01]EEH33223.1 phosphatidylinositol transporter [Paracoccidioides lutzii Pb01]
MSEAEKPTQPAAAAADAPVAAEAIPEKPHEHQPADDKPSQNEPAEKSETPSTQTPAAVAPSVTPTAAAPAQSSDADAIEAQKKDEPAPAPTPAPETKTPEAPVDNRPEYLSKNPALSQFFEKLASILKKTGHNEMWGVTLKDSDDVPTVNVLIKFLRANEGNVKLAEEQLTKALEWRKKMDPLALAEKATYSASKFQGLGYVANYKDPKGGNVVFTWNVYGAVKDVNNTFGDVDEFIKWRVALMELAVRDLKLSEATSVIDYNGEDNFQMIQVHDYQHVSFLRLNPTIRNSTKQTIEVFSTAYPELLKEKFFVNVPAVMGWIFTALKVFLSKNTIRKFHPITNGANLAREFTFADELPKSYGGKAAELRESARTVTLKEDTPAPTLAAPAAETNGAAAKDATQNAKVETAKPPEDAKPAETAAASAPAPAPAPAPVEAAAPAVAEKPAAPALTTAATPTA